MHVMSVNDVCVDTFVVWLFPPPPSPTRPQSWDIIHSDLEELNDLYD